MVDYILKDWPYILIKFGPTIDQTIFDEHIKNLLNLYETAKKKNERITIIFDLNKLSKCPMKYILKQGAINKKLNPLSKMYINETFFLTSTNFIKNILDILFTFEKPSRPYKIFSNKEKFKIFLNNKIKCDNKSCEDINIFT